MSTALDVIERAKSRHWSFNELQMPDGAAVQLMNERQRAVILRVIHAVEPLIGLTQEILTSLLAGSPTMLVAIDTNGNPYYVTSGVEAFGISVTALGNPYINTTMPLVVDPWGSLGSVPGLPLPTNLLRIIACTVVLDQNFDLRERTVEILDQKIATRIGMDRSGDQTLVAFINGQRLVPVRTDTLNQDLWSHVTKIRLSCVLDPVIAALTDTIDLPESLVHVLTAELVEFFASASKRCSVSDKDRFAKQRQEAEAVLLDTAEQILGSVTQNRVIFRH